MSPWVLCKAQGKRMLDFGQELAEDWGLKVKGVERETKLKEKLHATEPNIKSPH